MIIVAEGVLRGIVLFPSRYYDYILIGISRNTHEILPVLKKDIKPGYAMPPILLQGVPQKHSTAPGSGQEVHLPVYLPPVSHQE
jgi:BarA-like signal transduction histidine kinase